jgi:hypothetical protein
MPRTEADAIAEANVDAIPQEAFDKFAPNEHPTAGWSPAHLKVEQIATRAGHIVEQMVGGPSAHTDDSIQRRYDDRQAVGLSGFGGFDKLSPTASLHAEHPAEPKIRH